jgi:hypothetical protein
LYELSQLPLHELVMGLYVKSLETRANDPRGNPRP